MQDIGSRTGSFLNTDPKMLSWKECHILLAKWVDVKYSFTEKCENCVLHDPHPWL
jgi:hypothetical protein